jgi:hypothetical protein
MADSQNSGGATLKSGDLADTAATIGASLARVGVAVVTLPTYFLPAKARTDVVDTTTELFNAAGAFHLSIVKAVISGLSTATREINRVAESGATTPTTSAKVTIESAR